MIAFFRLIHFNIREINVNNEVYLFVDGDSTNTLTVFCRIRLIFLIAKMPILPHEITILLHIPLLLKYVEGIENTRAAKEMSDL